MSNLGKVAFGQLFAIWLVLCEIVSKIVLGTIVLLFNLVELTVAVSRASLVFGMHI